MHRQVGERTHTRKSCRDTEFLHADIQQQTLEETHKSVFKTERNRKEQTYAVEKPTKVPNPQSVAYSTRSESE
jgi:hypothetical protein